MTTTPKNWRLFRGPRKDFPPPPPWRTFQSDVGRQLEFLMDDREIDLVNAALYLRRPLLITGKPGIGKSSLAYAVAQELGLGPVLVWPINTRSTRDEGLYRYDAIGRLQEEKLREGAEHVAPSRSTSRGAAGTTRKLSVKVAGVRSEADEQLGKYVQLGPLGTAFLPSARPRVLLIDEIDKSDIDLPNDLLNIFEDGSFEIPVLARVAKKWPVVHVQTHGSGATVPIRQGKVSVTEFPFVVMTSNGERDFPQPFLRRCIRLQMTPPNEEKLEKIVRAHLGNDAADKAVQSGLVKRFAERIRDSDVATDQLLNAVFMGVTEQVDLGDSADEHSLESRIGASLTSR